MTLFSEFYLICCVNKSMNFKKWLLSEDIWQGNTATVFHRTCKGCNEIQSVRSVSGILTSDFKVGAGCMYGCGLYTTFSIESQFTNYMLTYGKAVVKFKVTDLDKYLIFQLSVAKQIHGKDYKISDQFKKLGLLNKPNVDESKLKEYDERQEKEKFSSVFAKEFYDQNNWIANSVKGIIYYGANDGYCLVKYPTVQDGTITMLAYAVSEPDDMKKMEELKSNIGWIKSVGTLGTSIKNVYKYPVKNKEKLAFGDKSEIENVINIFLKSKNLERTAQKLVSHLNKFTDNDIFVLLEKATDKDEMAEVIVKYKSELSDENVKYLIDFTNYKDNMAELIIEKKPELSDHNVAHLLWRSKDKDKIAELIIEKKPKLSGDDVYSLLSKATKKDEIAVLIVKKKQELSVRMIILLFKYANNIEQIAELLGTDNINKLSDKYVNELLHFTTEFSSSDRREQMAKIIIKYKSELSGEDIAYLTSNLKDNAEILELILNNLRQSKYPVHDKAIEWIIDRSKDKDRVVNDMIKILKEKNQEISTYSFERFIRYATDKLKMAMTLIKIKKQLSLEEAFILIRNAKDRKEMARLIDKPYSFLKSLTSWDAFRYKKSPEVQDAINQELKRRGRISSLNID